MGDMENLKALQAMLEGKTYGTKESQEEMERKFIKDVSTLCLSEPGRTSVVQEYTPTEILEFIDKEPGYLQIQMGGTWKDMDAHAFENLVYNVEKKLKKSLTTVNWK